MVYIVCLFVCLSLSVFSRSFLFNVRTRLESQLGEHLWLDPSPTFLYLDTLNGFSDVAGRFLPVSIVLNVFTRSADWFGVCIAFTSSTAFVHSHRNKSNQRERQTFTNLHSQDLQENLSSRSRIHMIQGRLTDNKRSPSTDDRVQKTDKSQKREIDLHA
jgi:hypothetical protein